MEFAWDPEKRESNLLKHGVDFVLAVQIFDGFTLQRVDSRRDYGEVRVIAVGQVDELVLILVCTSRGPVTRIISARRASRDEAAAYRQARP